MWSDSKQPFTGHGSTLTKTSAKGWRAAIAKGRVMRGGTHYALFDLQKVRCIPCLSLPPGFRTFALRLYIEH